MLQRHGCLKLALVPMALTALLLGGLVYVNQDAVSLMVRNAASLSEERMAASRIATPDSLLAYLARHPEKVSLVVLEGEEVLLAQRPDAERRMTGLPALPVLLRYAEAVERGQVDPEARIVLEEVGAYALPGQGQGAHERALAALAQPGEGETWPLDLLAHAAATYQDPASLDALSAYLDEADVPRPELEDIAYPNLRSGTFLAWSNHTLEAEVEDRVAAFAAMRPDVLAEQTGSLARTMRADTAFARRERERLRTTGSGLSVTEQRALAAATFPSGTARAYTELLQRIAQADTAARLHRFLERPIPDTAGVPFQRIAPVSGAFPGLLTFGAYVRPKGGGPPRILVLAMEDVPTAVFYHLVRTGMDQALVLRLLTDEAYLERAQQVLRDCLVAPSGAANGCAELRPRSAASP